MRNKPHSPRQAKKGPKVIAVIPVWAQFGRDKQGPPNEREKKLGEKRGENYKRSAIERGKKGE